MDFWELLLNSSVIAKLLSVLLIGWIVYLFREPIRSLIGAIEEGEFLGGKFKRKRPEIPIPKDVSQVSGLGSAYTVGAGLMSAVNSAFDLKDINNIVTWLGLSIKYLQQLKLDDQVAILKHMQQELKGRFSKLSKEESYTLGNKILGVAKEVSKTLAQKEQKSIQNPNSN